METDFINLFVQKQKDMINDLIARVVMLDTRASLSEAKVQKLAEAEELVTSLRSQLNNTVIERDAKSAVVDLKVQKINELEERMATVSSQLSDVVTERDALKQQIVALRKAAKSISE
jgi:uncharacterized coiled-coil DUF342 family protein